MARRQTVLLNSENTIQRIKQEFRSGAGFCDEFNRITGASRTTKWVSEWKRGRNLPSPEEAATMCLLLRLEPDELLLTSGETPEQTAKLLEDVALVRGILAAKKKKEELKKPALDGGSGLTDEDAELILLFRKLNPESKRALSVMLRGLLESQRQQPDDPA